MGKTADLTVVQKTIIDTLHKEGKPQTVIAKEAGCSQSAVSKHVNRKLSGRKKCRRKRCTTNRENRSLMRIVKQNRFKNLGELHKEWTEAGVKASRATTHRRVKEFGYSCGIALVKPLLIHRQRQRRLTWNWTVAQWSKVLFSDESKFCISFGNQGPRVWRKGGEAHSPSCMKSSVKFPQSVMIWGAMSSAGVGPLCFLKTNVTAPVYQEILEHFMLPSADQLFKDADFIFQQDLAPAHTAKSTKSWSFLYYYLLSLQYTVLHTYFFCTFYFILYSILFIFYFLLHFFFLHLCIFFVFVFHIIALSMERTWLNISLLVIHCIIVYVTNKILNLEMTMVLVCLTGQQTRLTWTP